MLAESVVEPTNDRNYPDRIEHVYEFRVAPRQKAERLDSFITRSIEHATRTRVQKAIERGAVTVNGAPSKSNYMIRPSDVITVVVMKPPPMQLVPENIPLDVLYEDEHLIVVNKPAGMPVHPGIGNRYGTLVNAVLWHAGNREPIDVLGRRESLADMESDDREETSDDESDEDELMQSSALRPGIVHRLDKDTSGVMVVGKDYQTTLGLSEQFAARTVSREYVALAWGVIRDDQRLVETQYGRNTRARKLHAVLAHGGKYAATEVNVVERYDCATLITCRLRTGRTHQIRVHLQFIKHPLVGDTDYGGREAALHGVFHLFRRQAQQALSHISRQALHARLLGFTHPKTGERLEFTCAVPSDLLSAVLAVRPADAGPLPPCLC